MIDLASGKQAEIPTHLHASALAATPDGAFVVCANAASDNLSVIETSTGQVVETIWAKPKPSELVGATPNALAFAPDGRTLYVANGTQNAIGVIAFAPGERRSKLVGLFPVGWFPAAIVLDAPRRQLCVANLKGFPASPTPLKEEPYVGAEGYNSHQYRGSVSLVPLPAADDLPALSQAVWNNLRQPAIEALQLPPRPDQPPRAVPERIGEPSPIKHVVYIIKENRTYDQVFGDVPRGNGDPKLCIFGEKITPNQHKLVGRLRAPGQHLLRGHPQRRRAPVEHQRVRHRLHGEALRRLSAELPGRHGQGQRGRPGLLAGRVHLGSGAGPRADACATTASSWGRWCVGATPARRASPTSSPATGRGRARATRSSSSANR